MMTTAAFVQRLDGKITGACLKVHLWVVEKTEHVQNHLYIKPPPESDTDLPP